MVRNPVGHYSKRKRRERKKDEEEKKDVKEIKMQKTKRGYDDFLHEIRRMQKVGSRDWHALMPV